MYLFRACLGNLLKVLCSWRPCHRMTSAGLRISSILGCYKNSCNSRRRHHRVQLQVSSLPTTACGWHSPQLCMRGWLDDLSISRREGVCRDAMVREATAGSAEDEAVPLKIAVGPTESCCEQIFHFRRMFGTSSVLVVVTLPKPLGIVFQSMEIDDKEYVVVEQLVPRSNADRSSRVAQMFYSGGKRCHGNVLVGGDIRPRDVLRASTAVGVVVDLFGLRAPRRVVMLHRADGRSWREVMSSLASSFVADGPVTLVLERPAPELSP